MKLKIEEIKPRASEGDIVELEGTVSHAQEPREGQYGWSQFIGVEDNTGEQNCWIKLREEEDKVSRGSSIRVKGKLGKDYKDKKLNEMVRSINNCEFEVGEKVEEKETSRETVEKPVERVVGKTGTKDNYWVKKFKYEVERDPKVQLAIVRQCAIKAAVELIEKPMKDITKKPIKNLFELADEIVNYIFKDIDLTVEKSKAMLGGETKEERTKKAEVIVGKTRFKPASTNQKNIIFGYKDEKGKFHKGMIDSRYIETHEIKQIGDPKKLSAVYASEWIEFWWGEEGNPDDIGARKVREKDSPRDENGKLVNALVKGDKTSVAKDVVVDEIYALRRENRLNDDEKFKEVMGYNPKIEELTEAECIKLKDLLKNYVPF